MNLPIIQSILHGELRTNLNADINYRDLANAFSKLPTNLDDIENLIKKHLSGLILCNYKKPVSISDIAPDDYTRLTDDHLLLNLDLAIPSPLNPKEKFYQNIVKAESLRTKLAIADYAIIRKSDAVTKTEIKELLKHILLYAKELADDTIHSTIKIQLICLYVEISTLASVLLSESTDYLSFEDLIYEVFQHYPDNDYNQVYQDYIKALHIKETLFEKPQSESPSIDDIEKETKRSNYEIFTEAVNNYRFGELDKVKTLNKQQQIKLIKLIVENPVGYSVVMLKHIGYFDKLKNEFNMNKEKSFKHIGIALQKSPRIIKGNYNILNPNSKEDPATYNAQSYVEQVEYDYKNL